MGSKERSAGTVIGFTITMLTMTTGMIADCYGKDSGDVLTTDFDDPKTCARVEATDTSITSLTNLSKDEIKKLPSPYPPDITCVQIKGPGYIK